MMPIINSIEDVKAILEGKTKVCSGLYGKPCFKERRVKGRLCSECYRIYMRGYMRKKRAGMEKRAGVVDGYDFNQDSGDGV